jgi:hypothetical protein
LGNVDVERPDLLGLGRRMPVVHTSTLAARTAGFPMLDRASIHAPPAHEAAEEDSVRPDESDGEREGTA